MKSIRDVDVEGKRVIMRVDFNVPIKDGTVTEDKRIRGVLPTIQHLIDHGARIVLASHLGRPSGKGFEAAYSMVPAARVLGRLIGQDVTVAPVVTGERALEAANALENGQVMMVENLRFDPREKKNDPEFARELAELGDIYVDDAFGCAHRAHASVDAITQYLPSYAGFLLEEEVRTLNGVLDQPEHPFMAILGGAKVSDKIALVNRMLDIVDVLVIGGGMCFTFLKAQGLETGTSLVEEDWIERAGEMLEKARENNVELLLPIDFVVADMVAESAKTAICDATEIPDDMMGLDIGPETVKLYAAAIAEAKTVFWNGPMGVFEIDQFAKGTEAVARAIAESDCTSIIGGGDSVAAINKFGLADKMSWISTGGGASMELVEGKALPGVEALLDA